MPCWRPPNSTKTSSRRMAATRPLCSDSGSKRRLVAFRSADRADRPSSRCPSPDPIRLPCSGESLSRTLGRGTGASDLPSEAASSEIRSAALSRERPGERGARADGRRRFGVGARLQRSPTAHCPPLPAHCRLPTAHCRLSTAALPIAHCPLDRRLSTSIVGFRSSTSRLPALGRLLGLVGRRSVSNRGVAGHGRPPDRVASRSEFAVAAPPHRRPLDAGRPAVRSADGKLLVGWFPAGPSGASIGLAWLLGSVECQRVSPRYAHYLTLINGGSFVANIGGDSKGRPDRST